MKQNDSRTPPQLRYAHVASDQEGWRHYRAIHAISGLPISSGTWARLLSLHPTLASEFSSVLRQAKWKGMLFECRGSNDSTPFEFAVGPSLELGNVTEADPKPFSEHLFGSTRHSDDNHEVCRMEVDWDAGSSVRVRYGSDCSWDTISSGDDMVENHLSKSTSDCNVMETREECNNEDDDEIECCCTFPNLGGDATLIAPRPASVSVARNIRLAHLARYVELTSLEEAGKLWSYVATEYDRMLTKYRNSNQLVFLSTNGLGVSYLHFRLEQVPKYYNYGAFCRSHVGVPSIAKNERMLQIQIVSDLHIEFDGLESASTPDNLIVPRAPVLALLGDIGLAFTDSLRAFLHKQADQFEKVLFVVGNHELYNVRGSKTRSVSEQWEWLTNVCRERDNIRLLEKEALDICGVRILGTSLWSDIPDDTIQHAEMSMNDYALSFTQTDDGKELRNLSATETRQWYRENLQWLRGELDRARHEGIPTIVLTHHTPQLKGTSHPKYTGDALTCCFSSDLTELLSFPVKVWACGHTHFNFDFNVGGTRLLSNQRGYKGQEKTDYCADGLVVSIDQTL